MQLDPIPDGVCSDVVLKLNEQQFVFVSDDVDWEGFYIYNLHLQEFVRWIEYPPDTKKLEYCLQFDAIRNILYCTGYNIPIFMIDIQDCKLKTKTTLIEGGMGTILNVNGTIHLIGGIYSDKHLVLNHDTRDVSEIYNFETPLDLDISLIHVYSKEMMLMIEGRNIWKYKLNTQKWEKNIKLPFDHQALSPILTSDEKYIIISTHDGGGIFVLDISSDDYLLFQSDIRIPWKQSHLMTKTGGLKDELLVTGWIRSKFKSSAFQGTPQPPMYLMTTISQWYSQEELHCIDPYSKQHFIIKIKHIFSSLNAFKRM